MKFYCKLQIGSWNQPYHLFSLSINSELHWKIKWSHFDLKSWVTEGTNIQPAILSDWRIFESNWLDIESQIKLRVNKKWLSLSSQFDSNILLLLGIPVEFSFRQWLNYLGQNNYIFSFSANNQTHKSRWHAQFSQGFCSHYSDISLYI